jgi:hypothetical protein
MSGADELERNCRRLLAWYPAWHRQVHGEEMIGVLLAAAPDGQRRPGLVESLNIIWAAVLIRLRPRSAAEPAEGWRDALAVFSVVAPVALTCFVLVAYWTPRPTATASGIGILGLGLALPFVLLRLRRVAAYVSLLATALLVFICVYLTYTTGVGAEIFAFPLFAYAAETAALFGSPGPRRGLQILTWRAWTLTVVAAVAFAVAWLALRAVKIWYDTAHRPFGPVLEPRTLPLVAGAAAVTVLAVFVAGVAARSVLGRRVLLMFAVVMYASPINLLWPGYHSPVASAFLTYLPPLAAGAVALRAVSRSRRRAPDGSRPA